MIDAELRDVLVARATDLYRTGFAAIESLDTATNPRDALETAGTHLVRALALFGEAQAIEQSQSVAQYFAMTERLIEIVVTVLHAQNASEFVEKQAIADAMAEAHTAVTH